MELSRWQVYLIAVLIDCLLLQSRPVRRNFLRLELEGLNQEGCEIQRVPIFENDPATRVIAESRALCWPS